MYFSFVNREEDARHSYHHHAGRVLVERARYDSPDARRGSEEFVRFFFTKNRNPAVQQVVSNFAQMRVQLAPSGPQRRRFEAREKLKKQTCARACAIADRAPRKRRARPSTPRALRADPPLARPPGVRSWWPSPPRPRRRPPPPDAPPLPPRAFAPTRLRRGEAPPRPPAGPAASAATRRRRSPAAPRPWWRAPPPLRRSAAPPPRRATRPPPIASCGSRSRCPTGPARAKRWWWAPRPRSATGTPTWASSCAGASATRAARRTRGPAW